MVFDHREFWLPKDVQNRDAYQDAYEVHADRGLAAIADGVSSGLFVSSWAKTVVRGLVATDPEIHSHEFFQKVGQWRAEWFAAIDQTALAWHQRSKLQDGAATTLLWIKMSLSEDGRYHVRCRAIGDCCLFHVRNDQVLRAFPLEQSQLFDNTPAMLRSMSSADDHSMAFDTLDDEIDAGDLLVLCTDAIAVWALQRLEAGKSPNWESFWSMSPVDWERWVIRLREQDLIRYDDTTMVMLRPIRQPRQQAPTDRLIEDVQEQVSDAVDQVKDSVQRGVQSLKDLWNS